MINKRYPKIILLILVIGSLLVACGGTKKEDLFKQKQEQLLLAEEQDTATEENDGAGAEESNKANAKERTEAGTEDQTATQEQDEKDTLTEIDAQGDTMATLGQNELHLFYYEEITKEIKARITGRSYGEDCDVPYAELRYVSVLYHGFDGETHTGELIVNHSIAEDIVEIFKELYELEYPIERMVLIDEYEADDNTSMEADNTSAFNYRVIDDGSSRLSLHSYGMAIDINPLYNPYVRVVDGETVVTPENGADYEDRMSDCPYYIDEEDPCYLAFTKRGFTWGGDWKNQKDYQHFQKALE